MWAGQAAERVHGGLSHLVIEGFDVTTVNDEGQIERVDGFFGPLPPLED